MQRIHEKWKENEVVKLRFEGPPSLSMKRTHEVLEVSFASIHCFASMSFKSSHGIELQRILFSISWIL